MKLLLISKPENETCVHPETEVVEQESAIKFLSENEPRYTQRYVEQFCTYADPGDWTILDRYIVVATNQGNGDWPIPF